MLHKSFTLLELLITMGILAVIAGISLSFLFNYRRGERLDETIRQLAVYLEFAREESIAQKNGYSWGVHLENPAGSSYSFWQMFYGDTYSTSTALDPIYLPKNVEFSKPADGSSEDIVFDKITGYLSSGSATSTSLYSLLTPGKTETITINSLGLISY